MDSENDNGTVKTRMMSGEQDKNVPVPSIGSLGESPVLITSAAVTSLIGHNIKSPSYRSEDVLLEGEDADIDFHQFGLSSEVMRGLVFEGFERPSPIQLRAIPIGITGVDVLMKSKSGTGKTCVFSIIALEKTVVTLNKIQVLIISPCREIAVQTQSVIQAIGKFKKDLNVGLFIGGCSLEVDIQQLSTCHIAIGTPGRLVHLINDFGMDLSAVSFFVIDEADKLFDEPFLPDLEVIKKTLPETVQILAASATFENGIEARVSSFMKNPVKVQSIVGGTCLLGVEQYGLDIRKVFNFETGHDQSLKIADVNRLKFQAILDILTTVPFEQAIIFSDFQLKAERIFDQLKKENIEAVLLSGALPQPLRLASFRQFQQEKTPVLVATDLGARGLDYEFVNLVINYEAPNDLATYVHRMGRSGRYGTCGRTITLLGYGSDLSNLTAVQAKLHAHIDLILSPEDLKRIATLQVPKFNDIPNPTDDSNLNSLKLKSRNTVLSFAEALDYLESGGEDAFDFAGVYCCTFPLDDEADSEQLCKMIDEFLTKEGSGPIFNHEGSQDSDKDSNISAPPPPTMEEQELKGSSNDCGAEKSEE